MCLSFFFFYSSFSFIFLALQRRHFSLFRGYAFRFYPFPSPVFVLFFTLHFHSFFSFLLTRALLSLFFSSLMSFFCDFLRFVCLCLPPAVHFPSVSILFVFEWRSSLVFLLSVAFISCTSTLRFLSLQNTPRQYYFMLSYSFMM